MSHSQQNNLSLVDRSSRAFRQSSIHQWDRSVSIGYEALHVLALADSEVPILIDSSSTWPTFIVPSLHMFFVHVYLHIYLYFEYVEHINSSMFMLLPKPCMRSQIIHKEGLPIRHLEDAYVTSFLCSHSFLFCLELNVATVWKGLVKTGHRFFFAHGSLVFRQGNPWEDSFFPTTPRNKKNHIQN